MDEKEGSVQGHPAGEVKTTESELEQMARGQPVETFGGRVFVRWDPDAAVTAYGG
jgi:hypothetical protein